VKRRRWDRFLVGAAGLAITLGISFVIAIALIILLSKQPLATIYYFFIGPLTNKYYLGNMLNTAVPLIFTGLGIAVAFKASVFNLGGEGQVYSGALAATVICLALPQANGYLGGLLAAAGALATGAVLAGLSGFFKMRWGTDELISSFLISTAVGFIVNYFITGPLDDPGNNLLASFAIDKRFFLMGLFPPSKLNASALFALAAAGLVFFLMYYTHAGYEMRMCGLNREFSRYGGINVSAYLVRPMVLSGALHGLAGGLSILGTHHMAVKEFSFGMGWNGIAVSLIAGNHPLGVIPAAVFFAYLDAGAKAAMLHSDVTFEIAAVVQSVIFYLVTAQALYSALRYRRRKA
jgi:simple sugar transport system permease protein